MDASTKSYRSVCFDLDGTLLAMDLDEFLATYFKGIAMFMAAHGHDAEKFAMALGYGTKVMMAAHETQTNETAFWNAFLPLAGGTQEEWEPLFNDFYENEFGKIGANVEAVPAAAQAIATLQAKGYPVLCTTMPLFPRVAVNWRLRWAGVDPEVFARVTTYDNSTSVKPELVYFAENLAAMGVTGDQILMVGNNTVEDGTFTKFGTDIFFVTDWLIDPVGRGVADYKNGSLEDFAQWVEGLPECADPLTNIEAGVVDHDATLAMLATAEGVVSAADAQADSDYNNAAVARMITTLKNEQE